MQRDEYQKNRGAKEKLTYMLLIAFYAKDDQVLTLLHVFCSDWIFRMCHIPDSKLTLNQRGNMTSKQR